MEFGKIIKRKVDLEGNVEQTETVIADSEVQLPIRKTIEERVKIHNIAEEVDEYYSFSQFVHANPDIVAPAFKLDYTQKSRKGGYYYAIKCYTKLERSEKV